MIRMKRLTTKITTITKIKIGKGYFNTVKHRTSKTWKEFITVPTYFMAFYLFLQLLRFRYNTIKPI